MDMPTLSEAVGTALDELYAPAASTGTTPDATVDPASTSDSGAPPTDDSPSTPTPDAETPNPSPSPVTGQPAAPATPAQPVTPAPPNTGIDTSDLKAIEDRFAADHPELAPVLAAARREMERGLNRKFEQVASLRKELEATVANGHLVQQIPQEDLVGMIQLQQLVQTNPAAAADYLFQVSENLRQQQGYAPQPGGTPDLAALQQTPEWQAMRQYNQQQQLQQIQQALETQYAGLQTEFGGQPIPANQREHVEEECMKLGLGVEAIPMVWRSHYGVEYARQEALKKGQLIKHGKQGLSVSSSGAPAPDPGGSEKPKSLRDAVGAVCDQHQVR